ncbi:hypothetical protein Sru01_23190 [Sphaerisporangium rufum]|uniref:FAS1 domain-containing protein n=1 Tax=Sphaerisporangium rufum TaxID=1381558 RepID=A0A919V0E6_9ACTN|nr:fasciclin domain-containing protein [Sphaerisporangium rufum]GII77337.1 hypothetical protein Sru01_23190 [Sphaerisporangium rufum]
MNHRLLALPIAAALSFAVAYQAGAGATDGTGAAVPAAARTESPTPMPASSPVGPGCASLPQSGPGSPAQLANEPLTAAVSHIPDLSTLGEAIKKAGLGDKIDAAKDITLFAPNNQAFAKVPKDQLDKLLQNKGDLTRVLAYHVVQGRKAPADLEKGDLTTLEGGKLTVTKSDDTYQVKDAKVVCGNIQTRDATVYIIDGVLKPGQ